MVFPAPTVGWFPIIRIKAGLSYYVPLLHVYLYDSFFDTGEICVVPKGQALEVEHTDFR